MRSNAKKSSTLGHMNEIEMLESNFEPAISICNFSLFNNYFQNLSQNQLFKSQILHTFNKFRNKKIQSPKGSPTNKNSLSSAENLSFHLKAINGTHTKTIPCPMVALITSHDDNDVEVIEQSAIKAST
jgi:hypothetical protein